MQVERHDFGSGVNVVGVLPGGDLAGERVLVTAHYETTFHYNTSSNTTCPGADDNASGVAGLLETARVLVSSRSDLHFGFLIVVNKIAWQLRCF